jgi:hypothetical protein
MMLTIFHSDLIGSALHPPVFMAAKLKAAGAPIDYNEWNINLGAEDITINGRLTRTELLHVNGVQFEW